MLGQLILDHLPKTGVSLAFGYGSKVFAQAGNQNLNKNDLVDVILAVDDSVKWHEENFARNKEHYSSIRYLPNRTSMIVKIQEDYGASIYFNPYVRLNPNVCIKYGVIKTDDLISDLENWSKLYIAGRLHKSVDFYLNTSDKNESLRSALKFNKESAVRAALLLLPETFDPILLYRKIVGLSYNGDIRMLFGEDKNKIDNIASGQSNYFDQMYLPLLKHHPNFKDIVHFNESKCVFTQDSSPKTVLRNLKLLPNNVRQRICRMHSQKVKTLEADTVLTSVSRSINYDKIVSQALCSIVRRSSLSQSIKGLFTAGFIKSVRYSQRKLYKSLLSRINFFP